jgi:hypothetical protein
LSSSGPIPTLLLSTSLILIRLLNTHALAPSLRRVANKVTSRYHHKLVKSSSRPALSDSLTIIASMRLGVSRVTKQNKTKLTLRRIPNSTRNPRHSITKPLPTSRDNIARRVSHALDAFSDCVCCCA